MKGWFGMNRSDLRLAGLFGVLLLTAVLFGTYRAGTRDMMREMARPNATPDPAPRPAVAERPQRLLAGPARVIDGDTLMIDGRHIHLHGIIAPDVERSCADGNGGTTRCVHRAAMELKRLVSQGRITCEMRERAREKGLSATCRTVKTNLNAAMVLNGYALADRQNSARYVGEESVARHQERGLWTGVFPAMTDGREGAR